MPNQPGFSLIWADNSEACRSHMEPWPAQEPTADTHQIEKNSTVKRRSKSELSFHFAWLRAEFLQWMIESFICWMVKSPVIITNRGFEKCSFELALPPRLAKPKAENPWLKSAKYTCLPWICFRVSKKKVNTFTFPIPSGKQTVCHWKMPISSWFTQWKWWCWIAFCMFTRG